MKRTVLIVALIMIATVAMGGNVNALRKIKKNAGVERGAVTEFNDSVAVESPLKFVDGAITLKGFAKRASDHRESFFLVNHTAMHIGLVQLKMRYSDMNGNVIHERVVKVPCDLPGYSTRQASVATFDNAGTFYYYQEGKSRKSATPFKVSVKVVRYDVMVCNEDI